MKIGHKNKNKYLFFYLALPIFLVAFFVFYAAKAEISGIVINEIQISGGKGKTTHDYIEIYNKSDKPQKIGGWQLKKRINSKKTIDGIETIVATESSIKVFKEEAVIPANGHYLWANKETVLDFLPDESSTATITNNNSIALFGDGKIVDQVAWGAGHTNPFIEGVAIETVFAKDKAEIIKRKNFQDTGNNADDFEIVVNGSPIASGCLENPDKCVVEEEKKNYSEVDLDMDEDIFANIYANFEIRGLSKDAKVTWNFGDGHKSYLQKTKHKYALVGKYQASVKYPDDIVKNFTVDVTEVPHPSVKIVAVNANPKGSDTDFETITILNKSKKKINFNGWSVATGWKKLYNHPINVDFVIKAKKEKEITREFSKFTLNNTKTKIELRYPDGKVAYDLKYKKKKGSVAEGEIYRKGKKGWAWLAAKQETKTKIQDTDNIQNTITNNQIKNSGQENADVNDVVEIADVPVRKNKIVLLSLLPIANIEPQALGVETVHEIDGIYHFTPQFSEPDHYAVVFLKDISSYINSKANATLNYFLN